MNPGNGNPGNRIQSLTNPGNGGNRVNRPPNFRRPSGGTSGIATPGMGMDLKQTPGIPTVPGVKPREEETMHDAPSPVQNVLLDPIHGDYICLCLTLLILIT